jgi:transcriptional regulator with XRE-family HTH domain
VNTIGQRIRHLRERAGMTPFDLAVKARIRERNIRNWEAGVTRPSFDAVPPLAQALGVTPNDLFGYQPEPATAAEE